MIRETKSTDVRSVDRELLEALRGEESLGINELIDRLEVTATAVRQRLERLLESGLIEREKIVAGRGRPTYSYRLTLLGHRRAGADHAELAEAMWREIIAIDSPELRTKLLTAIARRLGQRYASQMDSIRPNEQSSHAKSEESLESRMRSLSAVLVGQRIPANVQSTGELPVLGFDACPHPDLATDEERRAMCHLEEQMLSEALGSEVHLRSCRLDGDSCCQFAPVGASGQDDAPAGGSGGEPL